MTDDTLRAALQAHGWFVATVDDAKWVESGEWVPVIRAALASATDEGETTSDLGSEYGRLLAERDRLIAAGVDPSALEVIDSLARPAVPALDVERLARALHRVLGSSLDNPYTMQDAQNIAREYAALNFKEPTE